jgi:MHS family alpha-ketoglutarate permease-like MFS transporter
MTTTISRHRLKAIIGGSLGNLVEWYDWFAYATFSLYFAPVFFPKGDYTAQLLGTSAIFAVGFLMRPLGAWVMGIYADRHGRKAGLALSVGLMCGGSLLIAIAPTHAQAGVAAPLILVLARIIQGLSLGGEYGASATYISEMAPRHRRGFWASFQYATLSGGQLAAMAVALAMQAYYSDAQLTAWGWRIPFVIGAILALVVYILRRRLAESPSFEKLDKDRPASTARHLWQHHRRAFILVVMMSGGGGLASYAFTTYMLKFLVNTTGFDKRSATLVIAGALVWSFLSQPIWGAIADRFGRRPVLIFSGAGVLLCAVPVFTALAGAATPFAAFLLMLIPITLHGGYTANNALVKAELFPAHIRSLGVALPYAIGNTLFAGTVENVALQFKSMGMESGFYWYVAAMVAMALTAFILLPETKDDGLIGDD